MMSTHRYHEIQEPLRFITYEEPLQPHVRYHIPHPFSSLPPPLHPSAGNLIPKPDPLPTQPLQLSIKALQKPTPPTTLHSL